MLEQLQQVLASVPKEFWILLTVFVGSIVTIDARRAWHQWRLDRRLARDPYILREEMREYQLAIGDAPDPEERRKRIRGFFVDAGFVLLGASGIFAWMLDHEWAIYLAIAGFGGWLGYLGWRTINDPEREGWSLPGADLPREAVHGALFAAVALGVIMFAVTRF